MIPPSWTKVSSVGRSPRSSRMAMARPGTKEGRLAGPRPQPLKVEARIFEEDLPVCPVPHPGPGDPSADGSHDLQLAVVGVCRESVFGVLGALSAGHIQKTPGSPRRKLMA